jgi:hypothetical protein
MHPIHPIQSLQKNEQFRPPQLLFLPYNQHTDILTATYYLFRHLPKGEPSSQCNSVGVSWHSPEQIIRDNKLPDTAIVRTSTQNSQDTPQASYLGTVVSSYLTRYPGSNSSLATPTKRPPKIRIRRAWFSTEVPRYRSIEVPGYPRYSPHTATDPTPLHELRVGTITELIQKESSSSLDLCCLDRTSVPDSHRKTATKHDRNITTHRHT